MDGTPLTRPAGSPVLVLDQDDLRAGLLALRRRSGHLRGGGPPELVVDLSRIDSLSSVAVAELLRARRSCRARGGRLLLRRPHHDVLTVLRRCGLEELFDVAEPGPGLVEDPPTTTARLDPAGVPAATPDAGRGPLRRTSGEQEVRVTGRHLLEDPGPAHPPG